MTTRDTKASSSAFQWNKGGWFGALFGGTIWLFLMAGLIAGEEPLAAVVIYLCYAVSIFYGVRLWKARAELPPYSAIQKLIVVEGVCALVAMIAIHLSDALRLLPESSRVPIWAMYAAWLVFPALAAKFRYQQRASDA